MKKIEEGHKYDEIQTAEELVNEIAINGISLNQNDQIRAQDIIGHSSVGELENLANGKLGGKFYFLLQHIWNIEDVIRFWNNHSNQEHKEFQICREKVKRLTKEAGCTCICVCQQPLNWRLVGTDISRNSPPGLSGQGGNLPADDGKP